MLRIATATGTRIRTAFVTSLELGTWDMIQRAFAITIVLILAFVCLAVLWAIIRYSFISGRRTHGWQRRLHHPTIAEVEANWKLSLPASLESLYRSEFVDCSECYLAPRDSDRAGWWYLAHFIPLTVRDVSEWLAIVNVPGIPIAIDGNKGSYYLPFEHLREGKLPPVLLRVPGPKRQDIEVAASIEQLATYEPKVTEDGDTESA